jgi:hypothetical protein
MKSAFAARLWAHMGARYDHPYSSLSASSSCGFQTTPNRGVSLGFASSWKVS